MATRKKAPKRESAEQIDIPGTDQDRDPALERYGKRWQDLKAERGALSEQIAKEEAKINARFAELDEDDPRKQAYRIKSGHVLRPTLVPKIKVTRPPSRARKAADEVADEADE